MTKEQIIKRLKRTAILCVIAVFFGAGIAAIQISNERNASITHQTSHALPVFNSGIGGPFTLTDHEGNKRTEQDYKDSYKLVYFGFTYCPAICPTELQKISQVLNILDDEQEAKIQPLFITIDPDRDTVPVMKDYVELFHPRMVGLTGTQPQIDFVKEKYKVFATKVQLEDANDYTMDHSSFIYLMTPEDQMVGLYRVDDSAEYIRDDIAARLKG